MENLGVAVWPGMDEGKRPPVLKVSTKNRGCTMPGQGYSSRVDATTLGHMITTGGEVNICSFLARTIDCNEIGEYEVMRFSQQAHVTIHVFGFRTGPWTQNSEVPHAKLSHCSPS